MIQLVVALEVFWVVLEFFPHADFVQLSQGGAGSVRHTHGLWANDRMYSGRRSTLRFGERKQCVWVARAECGGMTRSKGGVCGMRRRCVGSWGRFLGRKTFDDLRGKGRLLGTQ